MRSNYIDTTMTLFACKFFNYERSISNVDDNSIFLIVLEINFVHFKETATSTQAISGDTSLLIRRGHRLNMVVNMHENLPVGNQ